MKFFKSVITDPFLNLAIEDHLFKNFKERILLFYVNEKSVILGRNQNPWREIDFSSIKKNQIQLVRRNSGGGTVYHDEGNLNYCFMMPRNEFDRSISVNLISTALKKLLIPSKVTCRYDIVVDEKKISGSAYKLINSRAYHHGTMLINSNLNNLELALSPIKKSLEGGGIASVRSKVTNLTHYQSTLSTDNICNAVMSEFQSVYGERGTSATLEPITSSFLSSEIIEAANKFKNSKWIYGQTPKFTLSHEIPHMEGIVLKIVIYQGIVENCCIEYSNNSSSSNRRYPQDVIENLEKECNENMNGREFHSILEGSIYIPKHLKDILSLI